MSKTRFAVVPVQPFDASWDELTREQLSFRAKWIAHIYALPALPDEIIEEAAKAIFDVAAYPECRWEASDSGVHDYYRNMARAAARVFNGGKDE